MISGNHPPTQAPAVPPAEQLVLELARNRRFTAMVAHEMRNLVAPLAYGAELLGRGDRDTTRVRTGIQMNVAHLQRYIDDLLDLAASQAGWLKLALTRVDLREPLKAAIDVARPTIAARRHRLGTIIEVSGPVIVNGDMCRLTQIFSNLLVNAAKFTNEGGDIDILLRAQDAIATVVVRDNGIGIASDRMTHIFEAFARGDDSMPVDHEGMGLGLSIARQLVRLHGGSLTAMSAGPGTGSEFIVELPRASG